MLRDNKEIIKALNLSSFEITQSICSCVAVKKYCNDLTVSHCYLIATEMLQKSEWLLEHIDDFLVGKIGYDIRADKILSHYGFAYDKS